jgi:hypothetical protein
MEFEIIKQSFIRHGNKYFLCRCKACGKEKNIRKEYLNRQHQCQCDPTSAKGRPRGTRKASKIVLEPLSLPDIPNGPKESFIIPKGIINKLPYSPNFVGKEMELKEFRESLSGFVGSRMFKLLVDPKYYTKGINNKKIRLNLSALRRDSKMTHSELKNFMSNLKEYLKENWL